LSPARCLEKTNQMLSRNNDAGMFVTVFYGIIDVENGRLIYANAGHNPPYIIRHNRKIESLLKNGNMALGLFDDNIYRQKEIQLNPGDMLFLYTDGIVEAVDSDFRFYGQHRLEENLLARASATSQECIEHNLADLAEFTGGMAPSDDITAMAIKIV